MGRGQLATHRLLCVCVPCFLRSLHEPLQPLAGSVLTHDGDCVEEGARQDEGVSGPCGDGKGFCEMTTRVAAMCGMVHQMAKGGSAA